jgi:hypothetical protein
MLFIKFPDYVFEVSKNMGVIIIKNTAGD